MARQLQIEARDPVIIVATILGVLIVAISVYWLFNVPYGDQEKLDAYNRIYESVVRGTLLTLFTTIVTLKITFAVAAHILNKFADK